MKQLNVIALALIATVSVCGLTACTEDGPASESPYMTESALTEGYMTCEEALAPEALAVKPIAAEGHTALYAPAHDPVGLIVLLGDEGEGAEAWFEGSSRAQMMQDAHDRGFGLLALDRTSHQAGSYQVDLHGALDALNELGAIDADTPMFGIGYGAGGDYLTALTRSVDFDAIMVANATGIDAIVQSDALPPTWFATATHDAIDRAQLGANIEGLRANGVTVRTSENVPTAIKPATLTQSFGVDCALAQDIVRGLVAHQLLNADGTLAEDPSHGAWIKAIADSAQLDPSNATDRVVIDALAQQMRELYADGAFSADHSGFVLTFFADNLR